MHSPLYKKITEENLLPNKMLDINCVQVPLFLIADSAYPLQAWLMKPFPHSGVLTNRQKTFNYRLSRARIVVENAYGRLKGRWRRLLKRNDMHVNHIPHIVAAACILHNMCEIHNGRFNDAWLEDTTQSGGSSQPPTSVCTDGHNEQAKQIRNAIVHYLHQ